MINKTRGLQRLAFFGFLLSSLALSPQLQAASTTNIFRLHLLSEPNSLSPFAQSTSMGGYLFSQVHAPLVKLLNGKIIDNTAQCSIINPRQVRCQLLPGMAWSDGIALKAEDYLRCFRQMLDPKTLAPQAYLLKSVAGAEDILSGKKDPDKLGIKATQNTLIFELANADTEFIYNLAQPVLTACRESQKLNPQNFAGPYSGPYQVESWRSRESVTLTPNRFWPGFETRPKIEFRFVQEDSVALQMYQKGELDFLRRLPTLYIPQFKDKAEFHRIPQFRFDYIGFAESLRSFSNLRQALTEALNFDELSTIFFAKPRPGCVGGEDFQQLPKICQNSDWKNPQRGQDDFAKIKKLELTYSQQGGEDHQRAMEWMQAQWKSHLNLKVDIQSLENKIFLERLKNKRLQMFRKGLAPWRPTCRAVLENFVQNADENYIDWSSKEFDKRVLQMKSLSPSNPKYTELCRKSFAELVEKFHLIPMGPIYFSILAKPDWQGWTLNELNQLDLTKLHLVKSP